MQKTPSIAYNLSGWMDTSPEVRPAVNDNWQSRRELAAALRRLNTAVLTRDVPTELLQSVTATMQAEAARIEANEVVPGTKAQAERNSTQHGQLPDIFYEINPASGQSNAIAPPMHIWQTDGRVHACVTPSWSYEGPFEHLHGGIIALLFDQVLGAGQRITGVAGRTGTLEIRFHHPTLLNKTLHLVAKVDRVVGRKKFMVGELWADDVRTASCKGVFISERNWPDAIA
ncbi:Thioesterase superfamily protein [Georgfuchsia toluolica]|uniref:Acyl-coenzyme A thioesterase THEM4 n=1 Tax=Georgfuchsia toluolica TaxID=424218 RepID=A0A916JA19_9PROT|nr:PaaI family thioesterase [Georgfuchsia toluolica]CAG4885113.1 Thioesterase superfamily protein [Georgfuchsia toluolica]